ncbi:MAG: GAF domain-containing protein [Anaerolineales bacterium]
MSTATQTHPTRQRPETFQRRMRNLVGSEWFIDVLSLVVIVGAGVILALYLILGLQWQGQPFPGGMFDRSMRLENVSPFSDEAWPLWDAGLEADKRIIGLAGQEWAADDRLAAYQSALGQFDAGDRVQFILDGPPEEHPNIACDPDSVFTCNVTVTLVDFPLADYAIHFGVSMVSGIVLLALGVLVIWRRPDSRAARLVGMTSATLAVVAAGRFDLMTTFALEPLWIGAVYLAGGFLMTFALSFPNDLPFIHRAPAARYLPIILASVLAVLTVPLDAANISVNTLLVPLGIYLASTLILVGVMYWRRQYSRSPVVREQATFVGAGAGVAFFPLLAWLLVTAIMGGDIPDPITPVMQLASILFTLSAGYAILQYRLLETDKVIPEFVVYVGLTALLLVGYSLAALGLSLLTADAIAADNPILIAVAIGLIVLLFQPAYNYLRVQVDRVMFRQRRNYQERLEGFVRRLTDAISLSDVMRTVQVELQETVAPRYVFPFGYNDRLQGYSALALEDGKRPETDVNFPAESGVVALLRDEQAILYLTPGEPLPMRVVNDRARLGVLGTPLLIRLQGRQRLHGFLAVGPRRNGDLYTYEDLRFIENLVEQAAFAVERAQFVNDLEQRVRIQDVLSQVSRALNYAIDFDTLLELIFAQTTRIIDADQFQIVLYDVATNELYYSFYVDGDERLSSIENTRWAMGTDVISEVAETQKPIRLENYSHEQVRRDPQYRINAPDMHAWIGVPLLTDTSGRAGGLLGVMGIGSSDVNITFSNDQLQILQDVANIAASAIDKTQLFAKTEQRAAQLKALNDISSQLASELEDVDRLLETITESAVEILGCEAGSLILVDERSEDFVFRVVAGGAGDELVGTRIKRDEPSLAADAINRIEPIIVNDLASETRWHGEISENKPGEFDEETTEIPKEDLADDGSGFRSRVILTVPLVAQNEAIGALQVINKTDNSYFTDEDAALATTFAGQAAVAIQNARLFESQDKQLLARVEELENMAAIDHSLNQTLNLDQLIEIVMDWALRQTGASHGALLTTTEDRKILTLKTSRNYAEDSLFAPSKQGESIPRETGILKRVIRSRTPAFVPDVARDPDYTETLPGCRAQIAVPMIQGPQVIGAILVETTQDGVLDLFDLGFLQRLVERASSAISNAMLYTQLEDQQKARADFVSFIAHELKNPLTSMKGYTSLLVRGVVGELNTQQTQFLQTVHNNVEHMEHLVNDIRDMEFLEAKRELKLSLASLQVRPVLDDAVSTVQQAFQEKNQTLDIDVPEDLPEVYADSTRLNQIFINFLTNANKYTPADGHIVVRATAADNEWDPKGARRVLHIEIQDDGYGISQEDLERLFEKYFRSTNQKALDEKGTGLGLTLTRQLIEQQGGKIWVESELEQGTTFHFTLPLTTEIVTARV